MLAHTLLAAAMAAVASAQLPLVARRDFMHGLVARQKDSGDAKCTEAINSLMPIYTQLPLPSDDLLSALPSDIMDDACATGTATLTGAVSSSYAAYTSSVLDWVDAHSAVIASAVSICPDLIRYQAGVPVCTTALGAFLSDATASASGSVATTGPASTGTGSAMTTGTGTGTATGTRPTSTTGATVESASLPREDGMIAACAAAAIFIVTLAIAL